MATLVHYTYTVPLLGLVDWSAFLEGVLSTMTETMGPMEGATWKAWVIHSSNREMSVNAIQACLGLWLALLGPIASPNGPNGCAISDITVILRKVAQNPAVLAS